MNSSSTDRCLRHIFLNSIIIKQVKSSDTEWLCSGWSCQKALAEGVGAGRAVASHGLQEGSDSLVEPSLVCCTGGRRELQLLTSVHKCCTKDLPPGFLSCRDPASRNQSADKNLLSSSTLWCCFFSP